MSEETLEPEKWVENYADMLYRYTLVRVKDPDVADELVQATLFAALKSQHTLDNFRSSKKISIAISPMLTQTVSSLTQRGI